MAEAVGILLLEAVGVVGAESTILIPGLSLAGAVGGGHALHAGVGLHVAHRLHATAVAVARALDAGAGGAHAGATLRLVGAHTPRERVTTAVVFGVTNAADTHTQRLLRRARSTATAARPAKGANVHNDECEVPAVLDGVVGETEHEGSSGGATLGMGGIASSAVGHEAASRLVLVEKGDGASSGSVSSCNRCIQPGNDNPGLLANSPGVPPNLPKAELSGGAYPGSERPGCETGGVTSPGPVRNKS